MKRFLVAFVCLIPMLSFAACVEGKANGWVRDAASGEVIKEYKKGDYIFCSDSTGRNGTFSKGKFTFGYFVCNGECEAGIKPKVTYLIIGRKRHIGQASEVADNVICIQANGSDKQYCWTSVEDNRPVKIKHKPEDDPFHESGPLE